MPSKTAKIGADIRPFPQAQAKPATVDEAAMPVQPEASAPEARTMPQTEAPAAPQAPAAPPTAAAPETPAKKRSKKKIILPIVGLAILGAAGWYGYNYWTVGRFMISTDDAYVQADMSFVSPKITGYVDSVAVTENQAVKAGDPLVYVDAGDYRIVKAQAEAQIVTAGKTLDRIDAQIVAARASLKQADAQKTSAQAVADNATRSVDRSRQLLSNKVSTQAQVDDAQTALDQANAALAGADAQIAAADANIGVLQAQRAEAASTATSLILTRDKAERDLSFTVLRAPYDGVVGNLSVEKGDLIGPSQKLAVVVPLDKLYIVANFKETQLADLVPGEKVKVRVDALGDQDIEGTVSSLAPASGAVFSLLPPENATGNFTKVVQRVPVRIDFSREALASGRLRAGLSVVVDVDNRTAPTAVAQN